MEAILLFKGSEKFYPEKFTATADKVREGKRFKGAGSHKTQSGTLKEIEAIEKSLGINETYLIESGIHNGKDVIKQNIQTRGNVEVTPPAAGETVLTNGYYMTADVIINPINNFRPEVIKKGVILGEGDQAIKGAFEGFVG